MSGCFHNSVCSCSECSMLVMIEALRAKLATARDLLFSMRGRNCTYCGSGPGEHRDEHRADCPVGKFLAETEAKP